MKGGVDILGVLLAFGHHISLNHCNRTADIWLIPVHDNAYAFIVSSTDINIKFLTSVNECFVMRNYCTEYCLYFGSFSWDVHRETDVQKNYIRSPVELISYNQFQITVLWESHCENRVSKQLSDFATERSTGTSWSVKWREWRVFSEDEYPLF